MDDNKNLFLAIALSLAVLLGWNAFFAPPVPSPAQKAAEAAGSQTPGSVPDKGPITTVASREEMLVKSPRVSIETPRLIGSLLLTGGEQVLFGVFRERCNDGEARQTLVLVLVVIVLPYTLVPHLRGAQKEHLMRAEHFVVFAFYIITI